MHLFCLPRCVLLRLPWRRQQAVPVIKANRVPALSKAS
jgi:hypothetical protein